MVFSPRIASVSGCPPESITQTKGHTWDGRRVVLLLLLVVVVVVVVLVLVVVVVLVVLVVVGCYRNGRCLMCVQVLLLYTETGQPKPLVNWSNKISDQHSPQTLRQSCLVKTFTHMRWYYGVAHLACSGPMLLFHISCLFSDLRDVFIFHVVCLLILDKPKADTCLAPCLCDHHNKKQQF